MEPNKPKTPFEELEIKVLQKFKDLEFQVSHHYRHGIPERGDVIYYAYKECIVEEVDERKALLSVRTRDLVISSVPLESVFLPNDNVKAVSKLIVDDVAILEKMCPAGLQLNPAIYALFEKHWTVMCTHLMQSNLNLMDEENMDSIRLRLKLCKLAKSESNPVYLDIPIWIEVN